MRPTRTMPRVSSRLTARARTRPVRRCSSSFASAGKSADANRPALPERKRGGRHGTPFRQRSRNQKKVQKDMGRTQHHPKPQIVVPVVGLIPVAVGTARVVPIVVERATAHDLSGPPDRVFHDPTGVMITRKDREVAGEVSPAPPRETEDQSDGARSYPSSELTGGERNTTRNPRSKCRRPGRSLRPKAQRATYPT